MTRQTLLFPDVPLRPPDVPPELCRCVICDGQCEIRPGRGPHFAGAWCPECRCFRWIPKPRKECGV
jgi:hypothetical protein